MNYRLALIILLVLLMTPFIFSDISLTIDGSLNNFYISNNSSKNVPINLISDYSGSFGNNLRAEYTLDSFSTLNNLEVSLSKKEEYFLSNVNSQISLNIRSYRFNDQKIKLKIKASLFDVYNNLLDSSYIYVDLISNNSEYDFSGSPKNKVPEYKGYSLSKKKLLILNQLDSDKITITNHIDNKISYGTKCSVDKEGLILNLRYIGNNQYSLRVSIDQNKFVDKDIFTINCVAYYRENNFTIKPINVIYLNQDLNLPLETVIKEDEYLNQDLNLSLETVIKKDEIKNSAIKDFFNKILIKLKS